MFIFANVVFKGMASWPKCHIVNSTSYTIWERVKYLLLITTLEMEGCIKKFTAQVLRSVSDVYLPFWQNTVGIIF